MVESQCPSTMPIWWGSPALSPAHQVLFNQHHPPNQPQSLPLSCLLITTCSPPKPRIPSPPISTYLLLILVHVTTLGAPESLWGCLALQGMLINIIQQGMVGTKENWRVHIPAKDSHSSINYLTLCTCPTSRKETTSVGQDSISNLRISHMESSTPPLH